MTREFTRKRIIDVTVETIIEKGFDGMRTKEIAEKSGVSEATVFKYFKSKDELMKIIVTDMIEKFTTESKVLIGKIIKDFSVKNHKLSYRELLKKIIIERLSFFMKENKLINILVREMLINNDLKKLFIDNIYNNLTGIFEVLIIKGIEAGEFIKGGAVKTVKDMIFGLIIYNTVVFPTIHHNDINETRTAEIAETILNGISYEKALKTLRKRA